jgi:hypothetical protein
MRPVAWLLLAKEQLELHPERFGNMPQRYDGGTAPAQLYPFHWTSWQRGQSQQ